tara:strand:- start:8142 stop:8612 length:471 start_codon:yes stop_codon:yes gene_type:complete
MVARVRPAKLNDCNTLGPRLRQADKNELKLSCGYGPVTALTLSFNASDTAYVAVDEDDVPFAMFGVVMASQDFLGVPWMLGSAGIYQYAGQFRRECKKWLTTIETDYQVLVNYVHADNHRAIRWLQWLGFQMIYLNPNYGVGKAPFYEFAKVNQNV